MKPEVKIISEKKLIGMRSEMTLSNDETFELWNRFMPRRKEIQNQLSTELYCLQVYNNALDFNDFDQNTLFEKWATVEATNHSDIPEQMEAYLLQGGKYAVFQHKGTEADFYKTAQYIYGKWLPNSAYELDDNRAHFQILGAKYKNNDPNSEEEVWVPIK